MILAVFILLCLLYYVTSCVQFWQFLCLSSGFGMMIGFWVASETPLIIRILSYNLLNPAFGLLLGGAGLAALTGAPIAGWAVDNSQAGEGLDLLICGCIMGGSAMAYGAATVYRKHKEKRQQMYSAL